MEFWSGVNVVQLAAWVLGILATLVLLRKAWPTLRKVVRTIDAFLTLADDITYIRGQLTNNGGSTVKDTAQRSAKLSAENATAIAELGRKVDSAARTATAAKRAAAETRRILVQHVTAMSDERSAGGS